MGGIRRAQVEDRPLFLEIHVARRLFEEEVSTLGSHHAVAELLASQSVRRGEQVVKKAVKQMPCKCRGKWIKRANEIV